MGDDTPMSGGPRPRGAPPGTLIVDPDSPPPQIQAIAYGPDQVAEHDIQDPRDLQPLVGQAAVTWINVTGLGDADTIAAVGEVLGLHRLALEDVMHVHQRAKAEQYPRHLFIVARMVSLNDRLETEQVSMFLGKDFVLTFQERPGDCFDPVRARIREARGRVRAAGPDYLAYALLDVIVDVYFPVNEEYGERLEAMEDEAIADPSSKIIGRIHDTKHDLATLRRAVWPLREALSSLLRDPTPLITDDTRVYLRDCYDHTIQAMDLVEGHRELSSDLMNLYMSSLSNRMNEVMKVLTLVATIFIPLTFIAGVYGMNFEFNAETAPLNMPELRWYWGYPFACLLMLAVVVIMLLVFRKLGWLGTSTKSVSGRQDGGA